MIDIASLLQEHERVNIEVKSAKGGIPNSIWKTYSAFANTFGGTIVLGINEDKETKKFIPVGVNDPNRMRSDIWNTLNNMQKVSTNILLENHIYTAKYEDKSFIVIEVPRADRRDKPVYLDNRMFDRTFKRNHEGDYKCRKEEVKAMLRDQSDTSSDGLVLDNTGMDALNNDSIKSYRTRFEIFRPKHPWNPLSSEEFLMKIGAAGISKIDNKVHPTLGGLIFFGNFNDITNELPGFFLDYRERMSTTTRWTDRVCSGDGDWSGNVYDFYFKIIDRLTSDVKKPFVINAELFREDDTSIHKALREVFANALIHADYYGRQGIVIDKEFRKVKISNPGTCRISVDEAIAGGVSDARNAKIFNMFSLIKVGERSGLGLCDVYKIWNDNGFKDPVFTENVNPDRVSITLQIETEGINITNFGADGVDSGADGVNDTIPLSKNEKNVFEYLKNHSDATIKETATALSIGDSTVDRAVRALKEQKYLSREGDARKGHWVILR